MSPSRASGASVASTSSSTTSSVETQTSPADVRLSLLDARQLRLWASAFAPQRWIALSRGDNDGEEKLDAADDACEDGASTELAFVHVARRYRRSIDVKLSGAWFSVPNSIWNVELLTPIFH